MTEEQKNEIEEKTDWIGIVVIIVAISLLLSLFTYMYYDSIKTEKKLTSLCSDYNMTYINNLDSCCQVIEEYKSMNCAKLTNYKNDYYFTFIK